MTDALTPGEFDVELCSGLYFDVTNPDHRVLTLDDIATPLAKTCRYGGACSGFYSVAEHAVLVSEKLERLGASVDLQLAGLHHDDPEFCLSDIQRPVKEALTSVDGNRGYRELTRKIEHAVWRAFGQVGGETLWTPGNENHSLVERVDKWACAFEARHIMPSKGENWGNVWLESAHPVPDHDEDEILGLSWTAARAAYVHRHLDLASAALMSIPNQVGA